MGEEDSGWVPADGDVPGLSSADLSPWFNPFLPRIVRESHRGGGEVRILRDGPEIRALAVSDPAERVTSLFTRSRPISERLVAERGSAGMFADFSFDPSAETYDVLRVVVKEDGPPYRFRHPIRTVASDDLGSVIELLRQVYGGVNERWFREPPVGVEQGFLCELSGRVAGVGWVAVDGAHARLQSLTVSPPYRGLGVATDLVAARLLWAQRMGATEVLSEIAHDNVPSQLAARRLGFTQVGELYYYPPR